jgi:two-component system, chemotaxis family, chemotaxis protein CheY
MPFKPNAVNEPRKQRILVADDSAGIRVYYRAILTGAGYRSTEVADGAAAFDALLSHPYDLVITDLIMPNMDGFALLNAISILPTSRGRPPVIVCSALLDEELARRRPELRLAAALIAKPVQPEALLKAVGKAMMSRSACH